MGTSSILDDYRLLANQWTGKLDHTLQQIEDERRALRDAKHERESAREAQKVIQTVAQAIQTEAHGQIAGIVTKCLRSVFDLPYKFEIEFARKRGRTEAILKFVRGETSIDPMTAAGGGVIDVASFALRVACLILARPARRRVIIMDENFKFLSEEYRPRACKMLETLAEELGIQFIQVTHSPELQAGKVIEI